MTFDHLGSGTAGNRETAAAGASGNGGLGGEGHVVLGASGIGGAGGSGAGAQSAAGGVVDAGPEFPLFDEAIPDGSFESVEVFWAALGGAQLERTTTVAHSGSYSLAATNRVMDSWEGPGFPIVDRVTPGERYTVRLWVRLSEGPFFVKATYHSHCAGDESVGVYNDAAGAAATNEEWLELSGTIDIPDCNLNGSMVYVEGAPVGVDVFVDDVSVSRITE